MSHTRTDTDAQSVASDDSLLPREIRKDNSYLPLPFATDMNYHPPVGNIERPRIQVYSPDNDIIDQSQNCVKLNDLSLNDEEINVVGLFTT